MNMIFSERLKELKQKLKFLIVIKRKKIGGDKKN